MSETRDIVDELRRAHGLMRLIIKLQTGEVPPPDHRTEYSDAADEIERLRASLATAAQERAEMLAILHTHYVSDDIVKLVRYAIKDKEKASETICRLRGETDFDTDLKRFVHYVDHEWPMSQGAVSEIIDFAQGQKARAEKAESALASCEAAALERAAKWHDEQAKACGNNAHFASESFSELAHHLDRMEFHQESASEIRSLIPAGASPSEVERLRTALSTAIKVAEEAAREWDTAPEGMRAGKLLLALAGHVKGYRADIDSIHAALTSQEPQS